MSEPRPDLAAFLRAVNVGGKNKVPMAELRELFANLGYPGAQTYVQSGNIVFAAGTDAKDRTALAARIEAGITDRFGVSSPVILRSAAELAKAIKASPYAKHENEPAKVHIVFMADKPSATAVAALDPDRSPGDEFSVIGSEIHIHFGPAGAGRSKLGADWFDRTLKTTVTARNLRTCQAVLDLLRATP
jgi:uncharacterized protein (DUF1697 family)